MKIKSLKPSPLLNENPSKNSELLGESWNCRPVSIPTDNRQPAKGNSLEAIAPTTPLNKRQCMSERLTSKEIVQEDTTLSIFKELESTFRTLCHEASEIKDIDLKDSVLRFLAEATYATFGQWETSQAIISQIKDEEIQTAAKNTLIKELFKEIFSGKEKAETLKQHLHYFESRLFPTLDRKYNKARRNFAIDRAENLFSGIDTIEKWTENFELLRQSIENIPDDQIQESTWMSVALPLCKFAFSGIESLEDVEQSIEFLTKKLFYRIKNYDRRDSTWESIAPIVAKAVFSCDSSQKGIKKGIEFLEEKFIIKITDIDSRDWAWKAIALEGAKFVFTEGQSLQELKHSLIFFILEFLFPITKEIEQDTVLWKIAPTIAELAFSGNQTIEAIGEGLEFLKETFFSKIGDRHCKAEAQQAITSELTQALFKDVQMQANEINKHLSFIDEKFLKFTDFSLVLEDPRRNILVELANQLLKTNTPIDSIPKTLTFLNEKIDTWIKKSYERRKARQAIAINLAKVLFARDPSPQETKAIFALLEENLIRHLNTNYLQKSIYKIYFQQKLVHAKTLEKVQSITGKTIAYEKERTLKFSGNPTTLETLLNS